MGRSMHASMDASATFHGMNRLLAGQPLVKMTLAAFAEWKAITRSLTSLAHGTRPMAGGATRRTVRSRIVAYLAGFAGRNV
jgi:hypothetical protein